MTGKSRFRRRCGREQPRPTPTRLCLWHHWMTPARRRERSLQAVRRGFALRTRRAAQQRVRYSRARVRSASRFLATEASIARRGCPAALRNCCFTNGTLRLVAAPARLIRCLAWKVMRAAAVRRCMTIVLHICIQGKHGTRTRGKKRTKAPLANQPRMGKLTSASGGRRRCGLARASFATSASFSRRSSFTGHPRRSIRPADAGMLVRVQAGGGSAGSVRRASGGIGPVFINDHGKPRATARNWFERAVKQASLADNV